MTAAISQRDADAQQPLTTVIARRSSAAAVAPPRRAIGGTSRQDAMVLVGAGVSSLCTTMLLFGRLTSLSGRLGFVIVWFLIFLGIYAALLSLTEDRPAVVDRVMAALLTSASVLAGVALASVIIFVLWRGRTALVHSNFFTQDLSVTGPSEPLSVGGITHAITGTLIMTAISLVITVPLGVACAVFLNETRSRATSLVRTVVTAMTALPSILAGLFIFATWVLILGFPRSGLAASIAMSIMMLPIIIRSADVVLRLVPGNLREASAALGAPQWRTVWQIVLPTARSGLTTAVILGVARGVGETAPVLLTAGFTNTMNVNPTKNPMVSLPLAAFKLVSAAEPNLIARGFATAAVLMLLVLILFTAARILGGRPVGRLTKRQARAATAQSARDRVRIDGMSSSANRVPQEMS
ncbi:MAG: phosphate ABC transporter permease PstA [Actinomycetota bacterium]